MARTNNSKRAVLAFLSLGPRAGYDIQRDIQKSVGHFWSESYGQIYPALRAIVEEGLATVQTEPQDGKPDRKVYTITKSGHEALQTWLEAAPEPPPVRNEMLLKLFVGWNVPSDVLASHVAGLQQHFSEELAQFAAIERYLKRQLRENPDALYWLMTLRSGQLYLEARLQWCAEALSMLEKIARTEQRNRASPSARTRRMSKLMAEAQDFASASRSRPVTRKVKTR